MTFEITSQIRNFSWTIRAENKKNQNIFKKRLEKKQKKYYIMEHEEIRAADTDKWKPSWRNGRRAWFRSKFFHRSGGSTPPDGTKYSVKNCGYGITAVHQPSKLVIGVRPPLPAPLSSVGFPSGQRGQTVNLLAQLSMVRIHLPPPFTYSTVCKDGFFVLKLPILQRFFHLAEKWWKDWLCSTNIPQFAHICGKSPSTMSEVQK